MSPEKTIFIGSIILVTIFTFVFVYRKIPKKLKQDKFNDKWKQIQQLCGDKENWKKAVFEADNLLDRALKRKKVKGNSMGERLVSAQNLFTNNDGVWFGHKLKTKLETDPEAKVSKDDTKKALIGIGQALKDLGALK